MSVEWTSTALDRLADIYVEAEPSERDAIGRGAERINAQLALDPSSLGESRGPRRRIWFSHPLAVSYYLPPGGGVIVYHVAKLKARPESA